MDAEEDDGEVTESESEAEDDGDRELSDLDPNAEERARQVDRQLRRLHRETRRN